MLKNDEDCFSNNKILKSQQIFKVITAMYIMNKSIRLH